jgi:hypothetical protein
MIMEYQAGRGTTALGIVGTVLGSIGTAGVLGNGNLLGMGGNACPPCGDNMPVNRYEMQQEQRIGALEAAAAQKDAYIYTTDKLNDFRNYVDGKFACVNNELRDIAVYQATNPATVSCMGQQIAGIQGVLAQITKCVVPNTAVCPGWGNVTITPAAAPTTGA